MRPSLNRMFDEFNQRYFGGKLRKRPVRWFVGNKRMAGWHFGLCTPRAIYIARSLTPEQAAETLIHEMCHIGAKSHGPKWRANIQRVKELGAPVSPTDLGPGLRVRTPGYLANFIDDLVYNQPHEFVTWKEARRVIAREAVMTLAQVERLRWPRKRYTRRCKEVIEDERRQAPLRARLGI